MGRAGGEETGAVVVMNRGRKRRTCLKCGRWFMSAGPGNRRCLRCEEALAGVNLRGEPPVAHWPRWILPPEREE